MNINFDIISVLIFLFYIFCTLKIFKLRTRLRHVLKTAQQIQSFFRNYLKVFHLIYFQIIEVLNN
jgi:hypothetical protein